jgi:hypothetical protein
MGERLTESFPKRIISDSKYEMLDHDQHVPALSCDFTDVAGKRFTSVNWYPSFFSSFSVCATTVGNDNTNAAAKIIIFLIIFLFFN